MTEYVSPIDEAAVAPIALAERPPDRPAGHLQGAG